MWKRMLCLVVVGLVGSVATSPELLKAAPPQLTAIQPRGVQLGATTRVTFSGRNLQDSPKLLATFAVAEAKLISAKANQVVMDIRPQEGALPGFHLLWISTAQGVSNPVSVAVDYLPQRNMQPVVEALPVALSGAVSGTRVQTVRFPGQKGQVLVVDVEAQRLGSSLRPAVELFDPRGVPIGYSQWMPSLEGDARLVIRLPATGQYEVKLHDVLYRGGGFYRLKLGTLPVADLVFPPVVQRGQATSVQLLGPHPPQGHSTGQSKDPASGLLVPWKPQGVVAPVPGVLLSDWPQFLETQLPKKLSPPLGINARLEAPGRVDRFVIRVRPGMRLRAEVLGQRIGSPLDAVLTVQAVGGKGLGASNDQPQTLDPRVDFTVPKGTTQVALTVRDQLGRGGESFIYHLRVHPLPHPEVSARFDLSRILVPQGSTAVVEVRLTRRDYSGEVRIVPQELPAGVQVHNNIVPPGVNRVLMALTATGASAGQVQLVRWLLQDDQGRTLGMVSIPGLKVPRHPWLENYVAVAVVPEPKLQVAWVAPKLPQALERGTVASLPVQLIHQGTSGPVRLKLRTSQEVPTVQVRPGQRRPDRKKALRLESPVEISPSDQQALVPVIVPASLKEQPYDLVVEAELLSADKKRVLARALTKPLRLEVARLGLQLQLAQNTVQLQPQGSPVVVQGKVARQGGFRGPVQVKLQGLPSSGPVPQAVVLPGEEEFRLVLRAPAQWKGKTFQAKVVATGQVGPKQTLASSNSPQLKLQVADKVPQQQLVCVLEDHQGVASWLAEKLKQSVRVERIDVYSGSASLEAPGGKLTLGQLPWLPVEVGQKPGQVRHLRLAWKAPFAQKITLRALGKKTAQDGKTSPVELKWEATSGKNSPLPLPREWTVVEQELGDWNGVLLEQIVVEADRGPIWVDHVYLAAQPEHFAQCPAPLKRSAPLRVFEDESELASRFVDGRGQTRAERQDVYTGQVALRVTPPRSYAPQLWQGSSVPIRKNPGPGQYRYICFVWKKVGGDQIYLEVGHEGRFGPRPGEDKVTFRYRAGPGSYLNALEVTKELPTDWVLVVRDLYADFGEFEFTGLGLTPFNGQGLYDHIYLGKSPKDFEVLKLLRP